jgi:hypothetical protein
MRAMHAAVDFERLSVDVANANLVLAEAAVAFADEARCMHRRAFESRPALEGVVETAIDNALRSFTPAKGVLAHYIRTTVAAVVRGRHEMAPPPEDETPGLEALEDGGVPLSALLSKGSPMSDVHRMEVLLDGLAPGDQRDAWALLVPDSGLRERILGVSTPVERVRRERALIAKIKEAAEV